MYIITTDTHLGSNNGSIVELNHTIKFFEWLVETSKKHNIKKLIHLGDFFDQRKFIHLPTIEKSIEIISELFSWYDEVYLLVGNHDIYFKNKIDPTSLRIFENFKNVNVIKKPLKMDDLLLIPWLVDTEHVKSIVDNEYGVKFVMGHLPINDILLNASSVTSQKEILNISDFKKYELVLSGHFHTKGYYDNIVYIGSPRHLSFNDSGERGVYLFDYKELKFIEYTDSPKYHIMRAEKIDESLIEGNNIRVEFYNNIGINAINDVIKKLEDLNPNFLTASYKFTNDFATTKLSAKDEELNSKSNKDILIDYIKTMNTRNLNFDVLGKIIDSMEKE